MGGGAVGGGAVAVGAGRVAVGGRVVGLANTVAVGSSAVGEGIRKVGVGSTNVAVGIGKVGTATVGMGTVGSAASVGRIGAAGGGACGSSLYHHGSLPGAGHNEASSPNTSSANTTAPICNPSRLSLVYVPAMSCRLASIAARCAATPSRLAMLCDGAER